MRRVVKMYLSKVLSYTPLDYLIQTIIQQHLLTSYCVNLITENGSELNIFPSVFTYIKVDEKINLTDELFTVNDLACSDYIIQVSDPETFILAFDEVIHIATVKRSKRKLIFILRDDNKNEILDKVLSMKELSYVANVLIIVNNNETENECVVYDLLTHQFVGVADVKAPLILDKWDACTNSFTMHNNLFPHNINNLQGKLVKVATFTYKPYNILDVDKNLSPLERDGIEVRLLEEFCRRVNCTIEIVRKDKDEWGEIFENRTGNGVLGSVVEDEADFGLAAMCSWYHEYRFLDFAASHIRTAITGIAPAPRLLPSWQLPLHPFDWWIWLAVFFTLVYGSIAMVIVQQGSTDRALLTTFGMMVTHTQPQNLIDKSWRIRVVTGWLALTGLVVDNAYGGGLATTFTVPQFGKSTDTIQDLVDSPMLWAATHDAWIFSLLLSDDPKIIRLLNKFRALDAETLHKKSYTRTMTFGIEKLQAGSYAIGDYIKRDAAEDLQMMIEEFYWEHCIVVARKSSPYTAKLSELVGRLHESGIILSWETQVALKYMDNKVQLAIRLSREHKESNVAPLDFYHTVGVFILFAMGVGTSVLIFIIEIIYHKRKYKFVKVDITKI